MALFTRTMVEQIIKQYNINEKNRKNLQFKGNTPKKEFDTNYIKAKMYNNDFQNVTNIVAVLENNNDCIVVYSYQDIELDNYNTKNGLFDETEFNIIDLNGTDTSKLKDMRFMFYACHVSEINMSNIDTTNVKYMQQAFGRCKAEKIRMFKFKATNCDVRQMFTNCKVDVIYF